MLVRLSGLSIEISEVLTSNLDNQTNTGRNHLDLSGLIDEKAH